MGIVSDLLEKIRAKRQQKFSSVAERYDAAVASLAQGNEVNVDELAIMLDELDLSDSDLEADVKAKQRRHEIALQIRGMESTEKQLEKNERELQKLQVEIEQFLTPRKARVSELFQTVRMQQAEIGSKNSLIHDLQYGPTVPRNLQARRDELNARRKVWSEKQRRYEDSIQQPRDLVRQYRNRLEVIDEQLRRRDSGDHEPLLKSRQEVERELAKHQAIIDGLSSDKASLDAEIREIEAAERQLNSELMKP